MATDCIKTATSLFQSVSLMLPSDFSGAGVVFYYDLCDLPFVSLGAGLPARPQLPVSGIGRIAPILAQVSSLSSSFHDGFHFIELKHKKLTHLAQFVSPPIPNPSEVPELKASGARHMTALLSSRVRGIVGVGILASAGKVYYYESGMCRTRGIDQ
jgi:hypothetical protein